MENSSVMVGKTLKGNRLSEQFLWVIYEYMSFHEEWVISAPSGEHTSQSLHFVQLPSRRSKQSLNLGLDFV